MQDGNSICRWGILGTAGIAPKYVQAMKLASNANPCVIGSRTLDKAEAFASEHGVERACGSYEDVLGDPNLEAIYIPLPTTLHKEWTIRSAEAGKHVLCEKPVGRNYGEVREMIDACEANGVQFMDGVMFMHHDRLATIRKHLPEIGDQVDFVASVHSFKAPDDFFENNIRVNPDAEPLGCIGDLGWYNVRFSLFLTDQALPLTARGNFQKTHNGVPTHATAELMFENGMVSTFQCSFHHPTRQWADLCGNKGHIHIHDFVHGGHDESPFQIETDMQLKPLAAGVRHDPRTVMTTGSNQEQQMIETFSDIALGKEAVDPFWPEVALKTQLVIDAIMESASKDGIPVQVPAMAPGVSA